MITRSPHTSHCRKLEPKSCGRGENRFHTDTNVSAAANHSLHRQLLYTHSSTQTPPTGSHFIESVRTVVLWAICVSFSLQHLSSLSSRQSKTRTAELQFKCMEWSRQHYAFDRLCQLASPQSDSHNSARDKEEWVERWVGFLMQCSFSSWYCSKHQ